MLLNYSNLLLNYSTLCILIIQFKLYLMKGGLNKILRNVAATKGKSDFDKVMFFLTFIETDQSYLPLRFQRAQRKARYMYGYNAVTL